MVQHRRATTARVDEEAQLAATVARRYFLDDESKVDIGRSLGISRFKAARLLELSRELGLVRIEVRDPDSDPLARELEQHLGLDECVVVRGTDGGRDRSARLVGQAAARVLQRILTAEDVLGLPWSRAIHHSVEALTELPRIPVVQLCGALVVPGENSAYDVARRAAAVAGGEVSYYHTPLVMTTAEAARAVREQPEVARALAMIPRVTVALCSVGAWLPGLSTIHDAVSEQDRRAVADAGGVGESMGLVFDADGHPVDGGFADRTVGISFDQARAIPMVVAMSRGAESVTAIRAAIRGGLVDRLVVDESLARGLLAESD